MAKPKTEVLARNSICILTRTIYGGGTMRFEIVDRAFNTVVGHTNKKPHAEMLYKAYTNMPKVHRAELIRQRMAR